MTETTFAQELTNITKHTEELLDATIIGDVCFGKILGDKHIVRMEFVTTGVSNEYDTLKITIMHKLHGVLDALELHILRTINKEIYISEYDRLYMERKGIKTYWNCSILTEANYEQLAECVDNYLKMFE